MPRFVEPRSELDWKMARQTLLLVTAVGLAWSPAAAQSVLKGIVLTEGGDPIRDAQVAIGKLQLQATVGPVGEFSFTTIPSGKFSVLARAIGFEPTVREFRFSGRDTVLAEFRLKASGQRLDSLVVTGAERSISPAIRAFEERRAVGLGRFLTSADLRPREHSAMSDVLRMTAGLKLVRRPSDCGGGFALATGRGGEVNWQRWMVCGGTGEPPSPNKVFPVACYLAIYFDGIRIWAPGSQEPPNLDDFPVVSVQAIELYRGPSELPTQYQTTGAACGAILLWSRTGEPE